MSGRNSVQVPNISRYPANQLVSSNLATLAEPPIQLVDGAALDYLVIEMVNTLKTSAKVALKRSKKIEEEMIEAGLLPPPAPAPPKKVVAPNPRDSTVSLGGKNADSSIPALDEEEEAVRVRLEAIGAHVGANLSERYVNYYIVLFKPINIAGKVVSRQIHVLRNTGCDQVYMQRSLDSVLG
jgi:trafficking protein particle complex subunit 6